MEVPMQMRVQLVIGLFCTLLGAALLYVVPVARYDCTRLSAEQVDCRITKRVLGFIPVHQELASHVVSADYSSQTRRSETPVSGRGESRTSTTTYFHIILRTADGAEIDSGETAFLIGDSSEDIASGIGGMIEDPEAQTYSAWQGQWFPMAAGLIFFLFGVLSAYPFVFRPSLLVERDSPGPPQG
jgi:hypothetical protein